MALVNAASALGAASTVQVATGADAQVVEANSERNGLVILAPNANSAPVFLTLVAPGQTTPAASAASAHIELAAGQSWTSAQGSGDGLVWLGRVRAFSVAAQNLRIREF
jgi:hypothetical protein